ncbi:M20/M25/M40 family metallo-hydrolase [Flavihumibacter fluvii]|uniref:M20/M25/M40 family metallo-hydrolase n=1 Tax=Flavihumibacter fluvii TaxID=2838157 RepID=UPI001BDE0DF1|nr:M20/M25/M40 family metallo-hydrolase [Flavihumibacter fluvii]ULQ52976.1 M20/M25/M40 family metallo-hydrolase [Flavihumibacter fluvii]
MRKIVLFSCIYFGFLHVASAQVNDSIIFKTIADNILLHGTAYSNLEYICKKIGPRLSGSSQMVKAEQETARMLREMGADTVYLQEMKVPHWVRGEKETAYLNMPDGKKRSLNICALGNSVGTGKKGITAMVVEVHSYEELDALGEKAIKGKIVYLDVRLNPTYLLTDRAYSEISHFRWNGASRAAKYGAVAFVIRSLASNTDDFPHTGGMGYNDSFPKIPALAVSTRDGDFISATIKNNKDVALFVRNTSTSLPLATGHNVIAEIRGSGMPDEIITIGGHLDSWDLAEGAQDDGAGCVQSMELVRVFKKSGIRPKRTIRVVLFTDEENSGAGGIKYAEFAKAENKRHLFAIESDAGGFVPRGFDFVITKERLEKLRSWLLLFEPYGIHRMGQGEPGADVDYLRPMGFTLSQLAPDSQRYFDYHHTAQDSFAAVSKRELEFGAIVMAQLVYMIDKYGL